ncbi:MAG TPA: glycosyltransferase 87 family protein [Dehalococcoidia bacterium]|nr:glycosyltransferase 87 family protein [Dehalococcoidia bacterium]
MFILLALGLVMEAFFVLLTQRFWLTKFFPTAPSLPPELQHVSVGFPQMMPGSWSSGAWWLTIVLAAPFAAWAPALWLASRLQGPLARLVVAGMAVVFALTLCGLYPITAADIFHYLADARTFWVYHQNPMVVPPSAHPFVIGISWADQSSPYGPVWQFLSVIPAALFGTHWAWAVIGFKLLAIGFFFACCWFLYAAVRRAWPRRELLALTTFAWSPFVLMRVAGNGHNDIVMMALAVAALYFALDRRWRYVVPLLALSALVKFSTLLLVPPVLVYAWFASDARARRELVLASAGSAALAVVCFVPFWVGRDTFKTFVQNTNLVITSVPQLVSVAIHGAAAADTIDPGVREAGYVAFAAIYLALLGVLALRPRYDYLVAALALTVIAYLTFNTWWFRPWYLLWFLPFAAMLSSWWWVALSACVGFGATYFDLIEQYRVHWPWIWDHLWRALAAPVLPVFVPLALIILFAFTLTGDWTLASRRKDEGAPSTLTLDPGTL